MDKNNVRFFNLGFTLIEIMVVAGILAASMGFGIARYSDYTNKRKLSDEAKKLVGAMEQASARAVAGDSTATCADFQGFQVAVTTTGTYTVRRCCEGACNSAQSAVQSTTMLPGDLAFSAPAANTTYLFNKLTQSVTINPPANSTITIRSASIARCVSITIPVGGAVSQAADVAC